MKVTIVRNIFKTQDGFTILEIIAVLVILGILVTVAVSRSGNYTAQVYTGADVLKNHLRYAQTMAMNYNPNAGETIWGIKSDGTSYWLFQGVATENSLLLPDDTQYVTGDRRVDLTAKKIRFNAGFTVYFDNFGIPYSAYTNSTTNTPLADDLIIVVTPLSGSSSKSVTITPLTGFIP